jgi:hypothetical protein
MRPKEKTMNNDRRKALTKANKEFAAAANVLVELKDEWTQIKADFEERRVAAVAALDEVKSTVEGLRDEEQDYYDNMPDALQGSDKGQNAEQAISNMDQVIDTIDTLVGEEDLDEADPDNAIADVEGWLEEAGQ